MKQAGFLKWLLFVCAILIWDLFYFVYKVWIAFFLMVTDAISFCCCWFMFWSIHCNVFWSWQLSSWDYLSLGVWLDQTSSGKYLHSCYLFKLAYDESLFLCRILMRQGKFYSHPRWIRLITRLHVWAKAHLSHGCWLVSWKILPPESISPWTLNWYVFFSFYVMSLYGLNSCIFLSFVSHFS